MLKIYGVPVSVHTRKVIVAAILKDVGYEIEPVIPFDPPKDWRALSPSGLIPAISHDGFELADSNAICGYLERVAPRPPIYPTDPRACGRALWLEQYGTGVLFRQVIHPLFHQKIIRPHVLKKGTPDEAEIRRIQDTVAPGVFDYLEHRGDLMSGALTIAEIAIVSNLMNYQYLGFRVDRERHPRLADGLSRALGQTPFKTALDAEVPFVEQLGLDRSFLD